MGELIYKDEAIAAISGLMKRGYMGQIALQDARIAIQAMAPVDAVPVVHGRWALSDKYKGYCECSECHDVFVDPEWLSDMKWLYCPHCGAKMDGGKQEGI